MPALNHHVAASHEDATEFAVLTSSGVTEARRPPPLVAPQERQPKRQRQRQRHPLMPSRPPVLDTPWRRPGTWRYAVARLRHVLRPPISVAPAPGDVGVDRDVAVPTRDGTLLRTNVFRSHLGDGPKPVIVSAHPYGKDSLPKRRGRWWSYSFQYRILRQPAPIQFSALTGWEAPDPAWWVAQGFVVINADLRGCGRSDGTAQLLSRQEGRDTADLIQWAGTQAWSDGRVIMLGVSYLAITQYAAAAERPSALRAIVPWEGFTDPYRDFALPGGVPERGFLRVWGTMLRRTIRQAYDLAAMPRTHPLRDAFWESLTPDLAQIDVPMLVCGSFSDQALHSRGSISRLQHCAVRPRTSLHTPRRQVVDVLFLRGTRRAAGVHPRSPRRHRGAEEIGARRSA